MAQAVLFSPLVTGGPLQWECLWHTFIKEVSSMTFKQILQAVASVKDTTEEIIAKISTLKDTRNQTREICELVGVAKSVVR